jgi:predicted RND superfamily exporter protein
VALLVAFTVVFFERLQLGQTDADVLPPHSNVRLVFDEMRTHFSSYGRANIYVALRSAGRNAEGVRRSWWRGTSR